jgi:hypothetical protein
MAVDLVGTSWLRKLSVLVMDDCLVLLESVGQRDRIRRVLFERLESLVVWKTLPWVRMLLAAVLLGAVAASLISFGDGVAIAGQVILGVLVLIEGKYLYDRKTRIRIRYAGEDRDIVVILRPGKLRRVLDRLRANAEATQEQAIQRAEEREADRARLPAEEPPPEPTPSI